MCICCPRKVHVWSIYRFNTSYTIDSATQETIYKVHAGQRRGNTFEIGGGKRFVCARKHAPARKV